MRIFKGSRYTIQVLLTKTYTLPIEDVKIAFYTTNPEHNVLVKDNITVNGNIASVVITPELFDGLEDGLLIYTVYATKDGIPFMGERQSNYYLKSNINIESKFEVKTIEDLTPYLDADGNIVITPDAGFEAMGKIVIDKNAFAALIQ